MISLIKLIMSFILHLMRAPMKRTINAINTLLGGQTVWCNPPYGREISKWVQKCSQESKQENTTVVMLIPARTDTKYFHEYIYNKPNVEIRFIKGRLRFVGAAENAPFPNMVVVFR